MANDEQDREAPPRESRTYAVVSMKRPTQPPMFLEEPQAVKRVVLRPSNRRPSVADAEPVLGNLAPPRMLTRTAVRDRSWMWLVGAAVVIAAIAVALLIAA